VPNRAQAAATFSEPRLEILNRSFLEHKTGSASRLAWFVEAIGPGLREFIWIDARTGGVLLHFNQLHTALNRQVYNSNNGPVLPGTLARVEADPPTGNADVDAAYDQSGITYASPELLRSRPSSAPAAIRSSVSGTRLMPERPTPTGTARRWSTAPASRTPTTSSATKFSGQFEAIYSGDPAR
jgi:hypothetical protein